MEKKKFSGWGVFAGCFLISVFVTGNLSNCLSLYMNPICSSLGMDTATYSLSTLCGTLAMAVGAMVWAPKMQKGNMKLFMLICAVLCGLGFVIYSFASNLILLILAAVVTNIGMAGMTQMPIALLMTLWFNKNRSTYMSIAYAGGGVGGAIFGQVISRMIDTANGGVGWQKTMLLMGIVAAAVGALVVLFLIKKSPYDIGQTPYEGNPNAPEKQKEMSEKKKARMAENAAINAWEGVDKSVAQKSASFLMLALCMFCIGLMAAGVSSHAPNYLVEDLGWTATDAGNVVSFFSLVAIFGTILGGILFDNIGPVGGVLFACVSAAVGLVCLLMAGVSPSLAYLFTVFYGLAQLMPKMVPAILVSRCFGTKGYAAVFSLINLIFLIGCAIGSVVTGLLEKSMGYNAAWIFYIVLCAVVFVTAMFAVNNSKKLREQYPSAVEK